MADIIGCEERQLIFFLCYFLLGTNQGFSDIWSCNYNHFSAEKKFCLHETGIGDDTSILRVQAKNCSKTVR